MGIQTCKKVSFANEDFAEAYLKKLQKTSIRDSVPQRAYLCTYCLNWHLTSKKDKKVLYLEDEILKLKSKAIESEERNKLNVARLNDKHNAEVTELKKQIEQKKTKIDNQKVLLKQQYDLIARLRYKLGFLK